MSGRNAQDDLESAIKMLGEFIRGLDVSEEPVGLIHPLVMFSNVELGGLSMNGDDARNYRKVLSKIIEVATSNEIMSSKWVEKQVQYAILKGLDVANYQSNLSLDTRVANSLSDLKVSLLQNPQPMEVYFPVGGISPEGLPFQFGKVLFKIINDNEIKTIKAKELRCVSSDQEKQIFHQIVDDFLDREQMRNKIIGVVKVNSIDSEAARALALKELRLTVDALSFFSDIIPNAGNSPFIFGERGQDNLTFLTFTTNEPSSYSISSQSVGPLIPLNLNTIERHNKKAPLGFDRVSKILAKPQERRNQLEKLYLASVQWAGRATAEPRQEEAFLLYMVALESLILMDINKQELNYRLRLRVAHLIGTNTDSRLKIMKDLGKLYDIRSGIVHNGDFQISEADLNLMRFITKNCIVALLTAEPFSLANSKNEIISWFDSQILSSSMDETVP